ncbi:iron-containing alcohol dehydrogenase [Rhizobium sp. GN54]|uniref:iron-containing alcohol dehydrogenase n=1 Tax=Rhizobium sp. GN54 TaxID=2898150 RepID=UPI001E614DC8|nr:iron-containing alcohol dehydrogenase [Rhizobium sp. GN54]MCD2182372.1 iron-containing alcohol dehydrogenase [Rhizobium sp. GN54]
MQFTTSFVPEIRFGNHLHATIGKAAKELGAGRVAIVIDGFLAQAGLADAIAAQLSGEGIESRTFSAFSGEPKLKHVREAAAVVTGCDLVIGIGGGSALDIAKIAACCAASGEDAMHYALAANPLPANPLKKILVATTAGTGSETSATNIFANAEGRKLWIWGRETKADLVLLDPVLTATLPATLTAWCGLDAFIHAFEAATNRNTHAGGQFYAHEALRLLSGALEIAVREPGNLDARGKVLLGSCHAGIAIDNCGTAVAHNISHALAGLAPVHHGLATALGFEATIGWLVEADTPDLHAAAQACGIGSATELPAFVSGLMDRVGLERALPAAFAGYDAAALAGEMRAPENQPMRRSTIREISDADIDVFARRIMALPKTL